MKLEKSLIVKIGITKEWALSLSHLDSKKKHKPTKNLKQLYLNLLS